MTNRDPNDRTATPREGAESEEQELSKQIAAERGHEVVRRAGEDDPREDEGWTQPESSAQKGAVRDEG